jgi:hypothetical protein
VYNFKTCKIGFLRFSPKGPPYLRAPEDGYAVFYSPKKIQQAQDLLLEKEKARELAKASREEEMLHRQRAKEEKQRLEGEKRNY